MAKGTRPFRVYIDPADDGVETVNRVGVLSGECSIAGSVSMTCLRRPLLPDCQSRSPLMALWRRLNAQVVG
jgi:hypothetical protein